MNRTALTAALLLLATNAFVLGGVAYNRMSEPLVHIELTERELPSNSYYRYREENSGVSLRLDWQVLESNKDNDYFYNSRGFPDWLNEEKLQELGFDVDKLLKQNNDRAFYRSRVGADVFLVLEYNGAAYQQAVRQAETRLAQLVKEAKDTPNDSNPRRRLEHFANEVYRIKNIYSRLFVVDAGTDSETLLKKYRGNHLVVKGEVRINRVNDNLNGYVHHLKSTQIHVPLPEARLFDNLREPPKNTPQKNGEVPPPRYSVVVSFGQRLEPWIESVTLR